MHTIKKAEADVLWQQLDDHACVCVCVCVCYFVCDDLSQCVWIKGARERERGIKHIHKYRKHLICWLFITQLYLMVAAMSLVIPGCA